MDYEKHLLELRTQYISATPRQRFSVARQRLSNAGSGPNELVARVSAIEAVSRTLAMHLGAPSQSDLEKIYPDYRHLGPEALIAKYLCEKQGHIPERVFGKQDWLLFQQAVKYRNLLVHECTYLAKETYDELNAVCERIFGKLEELAGFMNKK